MRVSRNLEKSIQSSVIGWAKKQGIRCDKLSSGSVFQVSGLPDFIIWIPGGLPLLIEFKSEIGKLSALQAATHDQLKSLGYDVHVINDTLIGKQLIKQKWEEANGTKKNNSGLRK
jgi:hypothetical protein